VKHRARSELKALGGKVRAVSTQIIITKKNSTLIYVFNSIKSTLNTRHKIYNYFYPESVAGLDVCTVIG